MKQILITLSLAFVFLSSKSQISFEHSMTGAMYAIELQDVGDKFFVVDYVNNKCEIYNTNYSPFLTVNLPIVTNYWLYEVAYVSTKVFNTDLGVELLAVYQTYVSTSATEGYYIYQTKVIDEDGSVLLDIPQGGYSNIIKQSDEQSKLIVYLYDLSVSPYLVSTNVYQIPGYPITVVEEIPIIETNNVYPNPSNNTINIPFELNNSKLESWVTITNSNGLELANYKLDNNSNKISIDVSSFSKGMYFFNLKSGNNKFQSGKFIVQ